MAVTAVATGLAEACERAYAAVRAIHFKDLYRRMDSGTSQGASDKRPKLCTGQTSSAGTVAAYLGAGVDIPKEQVIAASTWRLMQQTDRSGREQLAATGAPTGLAGLCDISEFGYKNSPTACSSTMSVNAKLKIALAMQHYGGVGADLVALCANDIAARGAEPVFLLSHLSSSNLVV